MANKDLYMEMTRDQSQRMGFHRTGIFLLSMYGYNVFCFFVFKEMVAVYRGAEKDLKHAW